MNLEEQRAVILSGRMYNDLTPELVEARERAVLLTREYNASFGQPPAAARAVLRGLLGAVGEAPLRADVPVRVRLQHPDRRHFYANFDCVMLDGGGITIGDHVLFGPRVGIYTSNHAIDAGERGAGACYAKPVTIGNNVWIGGEVTINQGVTIGDNSIVGSGSVVTRPSPPT